MTEPEKILWGVLRGNALGIKFRRQQGIGPYIADFYAASCQLVIEVDGDSHFTDEGLIYDQDRDAYMQNVGITVLRFTNLQVRENLEGVFETIRRLISLHFNPPPAKGEMEGVPEGVT